MKHFVRNGLCFLTVGAMLFTMTACGGSTTSDGGTKPAAEGYTNDGNYVFASGGTSGTYYPLAGAIATLVNEKVAVQSTGASK